MIRTVVFDMGNVLFDFDPHRFVEPYSQDSKDRQLMCTGIFGSAEWVAYDRGSLTAEAALAGILSGLPQRLHETTRRIFLHWHETIRPNEATFALADELHKKGYGVYLLSNAAQNFYTFREHLPGLERFDGLFISSDWRMLKPDPNIFLTFCAHYGLVPSQCFFIDDSPVNIEGAWRAGLQGCVFHGDVEHLRSRLEVALAEA